MNKRIKEKKAEKVKIPKQFKERLEKRFNPDNAVLYNNLWKIDIPCPLCEVFDCYCTECPFNPFEERSLYKVGCVVWIEEILREPLAFYAEPIDIIWGVKKDKIAREQLNLLRKKAEELIVWVDEEVK